jgi:transcriptional regulator with XRE-family HTH domain
MPRDGMHPTDTHVGKRLRMRRLMLGLSQTKIADALGLTFQQVQNMKKALTALAQAACDIFLKYYKCRKSFSPKEYRRRTATTMHKPTLRLHNTYQTISPRPTGSTSPKLSCEFQAQSFADPSSILSNRSPAPTISESLGQQ